MRAAKKKMTPAEAEEFKRKWFMDYTIGGWCDTDELRLRPTLFGVVLEQLRVYRDGRREWRRRWHPMLLKEHKSWQ